MALLEVLWGQMILGQGLDEHNRLKIVQASVDQDCPLLIPNIEIY